MIIIKYRNIQIIILLIFLVREGERGHRGGVTAWRVCMSEYDGSRRKSGNGGGRRVVASPIGVTRGDVGAPCAAWQNGGVVAW